MSISVCLCLSRTEPSPQKRRKTKTRTYEVALSPDWEIIYNFVQKNRVWYEVLLMTMWKMKTCKLRCERWGSGLGRPGRSCHSILRNQSNIQVIFFLQILWMRNQSNVHRSWKFPLPRWIQTLIWGAARQAAGGAGKKQEDKLTFEGGRI